MTEKAKAARNQYLKEYRETHREHINATAAAWRKRNPEKVRKANDRYWERRAEAMEKERECIT